ALHAQKIFLISGTRIRKTEAFFFDRWIECTTRSLREFPKPKSEFEAEEERQRMSSSTDETDLASNRRAFLSRGTASLTLAAAGATTLAAAADREPLSTVKTAAAHIDDLNAAEHVGFKTALVTHPLEFGPQRRVDIAQEGAGVADFISTDFIDIA